MKNDYVVKKVYHSFVMVSILAVLTATAGMLIDNIIVGQFLGTNALGAMGVVSPMGVIFSVIGSMFSSGGAAQAAQAVGRGDKEKLNRLFSVAILFAVLLSGIVMVIGMIFAPQIAAVLGGRDELAVPATEYLRGYFLGAIPTIVLPTLNSFAKIDGSTKMPLISIAVMSVADIILDLVMVLVFRQGMFGMALATTLSYCIAVAVTLTHFTKKNRMLRFTVPKNIKEELGLIVSSGAATAISRICITFETAIFNNLLAISVGAGAVAAMNVRTQTNNFIGSITLGVSQALMPIAGMFFGEEDSNALKDAVRVTFKLGMILSITAAVLLFLVAPVFAKLLGVSDPEILDMASIAVRVFAVGMPIQLINLVWMNFYQSTKRTGLATMICILEAFVYAILAALVLIRPLGSNGVWLAFLVGEVLTVVTLYIYVAYKNKKLLPGLSDFMLLDKNFGVEGKERWDLSIGNDMEQVMTLSDAITAENSIPCGICMRAGTRRKKSWEYSLYLPCQINLSTAGQSD